MQATLTLAAIDAALERDQDDEYRTHLGASIIGRECARDVWYKFRWAIRERHNAKLLRLFDRGRLEEARFTGWLRAAGIRVEEVDPDTGKQWRVGWASGHAGGSLDAKVYGLPEFADSWGVGEYKTHNRKSFDKLAKEGVAGAKWEHYVQMQIYMHFNGFAFALYLAVCKDDDDLYSEIVTYNETCALEYIDRAERIIAADVPPPRISPTPAWFKCRICSHKAICHEGVPLARNCRTCVWSQPTADATWTCRRYNYALSADDQARGCQDHSPIE